MNRVKGKVAVITGAGSGIGAACGQAFAAEGASVVFVDINLQAAEQQAQIARQHGAFVIGHALMMNGGMLAHPPFYADSSPESFAR